MTRRISMRILGITLLFAPLASFAMRTEIFEFSAGTINADWFGIGQISVQKERSGILLTTGNGTGFLMASGNNIFLPEAVTVTASVTDATNISFAWILENSMFRQAYDIPFFLPKGTNRSVSVSLKDAESWKDASLQLGLRLPPHTSVLLHQIELHEWNVWEQAWQGVRSFWTPDAYRPYSINFVWGPHVAWNPVERARLFASLPPIHLSATLLTLGVLAVIGVLLAGAAYIGIPEKHRRVWFFRRIGWLVLAAWILFDLRMGSEFLTWVLHDQKTYIGESVHSRTFRDRDRFYDFAAFASPLIQDRASYIFFGEEPWPYLGNIRYLTYPAIPGIDIENDDTWVIYHRPDVGVATDGRLTIDGQSITEQGDLLGQFDETSFVYRGRPLPSVSAQ